MPNEADTCRHPILPRLQSAAASPGTMLAKMLLPAEGGSRIRKDILNANRTDHGERTVSALRTQLTREFGKRYSEKSPWHMIRFAEALREEGIVSALRRQFGWTHLTKIIYIDDLRKRTST